MAGVESQLHSHVRIGMNVGLTASELRQLADVLAQRGYAQSAERLRLALERHLAEAQKDR